MKRFVIKIGTNLLTRANGQLNTDFLEALAREVKRLRTNQKEIVIVTSGAVASGRAEVSLGTRGKETINERQALAAIGQSLLMQEYHKIFTKEHKLLVAQILLQNHDFENLDTLQNTHNTLTLLIAHGVIPIINENDVTAVDELRYMANDRLAARVANLLGADALILLTDVAGLYESDPHDDPNAKLIPEIEKRDLKKIVAGGSRGVGGHGGMRTKLEAAKIAECPIYIADGKNRNALSTIILREENPGTMIR